MHGTRPQPGRLSLIGCKERRRLQGHVSACASKHRRARRTTLVVRELDDAKAIVLAESEKELVHSALEGFNRLTQFRWAVLRCLYHRLDSWVLVLPLKKIIWHGILTDGRNRTDGAGTLVHAPAPAISILYTHFPFCHAGRPG